MGCCCASRKELSVKLFNSRPHTNVSLQGQKLTFARKNCWKK